MSLAWSEGCWSPVLAPGQQVFTLRTGFRLLELCGFARSAVQAHQATSSKISFAMCFPTERQQPNFPLPASWSHSSWVCLANKLWNLLHLVVSCAL